MRSSTLQYAKGTPDHNKAMNSPLYADCPIRKPSLSFSIFFFLQNTLIIEYDDFTYARIRCRPFKSQLTHFRHIVVMMFN